MFKRDHPVMHMGCEKRLVVLIFLYDQDGRILLQHRTNDARLLPNYWAFFGGSVEKGEDIEDALFREAFEEINYTPRNPKKVFVFEFEEMDIQGHLHCYIDFIDEIDKKRLKLNEGQGWGWYTPDETKGLLMTERDRKILSMIHQIITTDEHNYF